MENLVIVVMATETVVVGQGGGGEVELRECGGGRECV